MGEHLEIEFKNLLTKEEFTHLVDTYKFHDEDFFIQKNIYFDTVDYLLQKQQAALRIRIKEGKGEITLKTPQEKGLLETTDTVSEEQLAQFKETGHFPCSHIINHKLKKLGTSIEHLKLTASLKTKRAEKQLNPDTLLVLDESWYHGQHDLELELETTSFSEGEQFFNTFLKENNISKRPTKNKIQRAVEAKRIE